MARTKPTARTAPPRHIERAAPKSKVIIKTTDFSNVQPKIKTKPLPYQERCVEMLDRFGGRALIADEMGLGKSFESLLWAVRHRHFPILIICPASVKSNWQRECIKHFGIRAEVLEGTKPRRGWTPVRPVTIINYDILKPWKVYLRRMRPQVVILDECHFAKNRSAARTRNTESICRSSPHVLALSGTPIENNPIEFYPILNILQKNLFDGGFQGFAHRYCKPERKPWGWTFTGASRMPELNRILRDNVMIRRLKKDVLKDLPPKSRFIHLINGDPKLIREYKKAEKDFLVWLEEHAGSVVARRASRAEQVTKTLHLKRLAGESKLKGVLEWADAFLETGQKLVLFAHHKKTLELLKAHFKEKCVLVNGSVRGSKRQEAVDKFQNNPKCTVFLGNLRAAGVGITLTAASTLGFVELGWTPGEMVQAEDRIHRISQLFPASIFYFLAADTIEVKICRILQKKQKMLESALDGKGNGDRLSVFDSFIKGLVKAPE